VIPTQPPPSEEDLTSPDRTSEKEWIDLETVRVPILCPVTAGPPNTNPGTATHLIPRPSVGSAKAGIHASELSHLSCASSRQPRPSPLLLTRPPTSSSLLETSIHFPSDQSHQFENSSSFVLWREPVRRAHAVKLDRNTPHPATPLPSNREHPTMAPTSMKDMLMDEVLNRIGKRQI